MDTINGLRYSDRGGMVCADNNYPENHRYFSGDGVHGSLPLNFFINRYLEAYANEITIFCNAVINNLPLPVSGNDGLMSVAVHWQQRNRTGDNPVKLTEYFKEIIGIFLPRDSHGEHGEKHGFISANDMH